MLKERRDLGRNDRKPRRRVSVVHTYSVTPKGSPCKRKHNVVLTCYETLGMCQVDIVKLKGQVLVGI